MCRGGRGEGGGRCTAGGGGGGGIQSYTCSHKLTTRTHHPFRRTSHAPMQSAASGLCCRDRASERERESERERARESEGRKSQAVSTDFTCSPTSEPLSVAVPASQSHGGNGGPASVLAEVRERQRTPERGTIRLERERERERAKRKRCVQ